MYRISLFFISLLIISCQSYTKFYKQELPLKDTIYHLDLSNRNFKTQPDLSEYTIVKLNLSNNKIRKFEEKKLPKALQNLNFSSNKLNGNIYFSTKPNFESLDFSNNKIEKFGYSGIAKNLNLSKNKLRVVNLGQHDFTSADTLNVADNKDLETKYWGFPNFYNHVINYSITTKN